MGPWVCGSMGSETCLGGRAERVCEEPTFRPTKNGGAGRNCTAVRKNVPTGVYVRSVVYFLVPAVKTMQNQPEPAPGNLVATIQSNQWPPAR